MDDNDLLDRYCRHGEQQAFAELVRRHSPWIYPAARRQLGDAHLAEDAAQAVFLLLARKAARLSPSSNLGAWLFGTLRYCIKETQRQRSRQQRREKEGAHMRPEPAPEARWEDIAPLLDEAIARLGKSDRKAIVLRFYQRKSLAEVGQALGTTEEAARKRVDRAVEKLRAKLADKGVEAETIGLSAVVFAHAAEGGPVGFVERVMAGIRDGSGQGAAGAIAKGATRMIIWTKVKIVAGLCAVVVLATGLGVFAAGPDAAVRVEGGDRLREILAGAEGASASIQTIRAHLLITSELDEPGKPKVNATRDVQWVGKGQRSHFTTKMRQMVDGKVPRAFDIKTPSALYPALDTETARSGTVQLVYFPGQNRAERREQLSTDPISMDDAAADVRFFGFAIGGLTLPDLLAGKPTVAGEPEVPAEHIVKSGGKVMYEGREIDSIIAEAHWGGGNRAYYMKVYVDPDRGYTIPYYESDFEIRGKRQRDITVVTECVNSGGFWAPKRTVLTKLVSGASGEGTYRLVRDLTDVVINAPISDEELRVALPDGCRIFDHILNADQTFGASNGEVLGETKESLARRIPATNVSGPPSQP